ncbi:MAG: EAL domain-containing protein [Lachnospiraceae bacterium]|nr:EAL domain-containing protein [Lachnospiraceae bacterium]
MNHMEKDYLTNLPSRRSLYQYYNSLDEGDKVHGMFLDVDNYKRINDFYGHSMGDRLMVCIGRFLQENAKGFAARIGGDEFFVVLDGKMTEEEVSKLARNLIKQFKEMDFREEILSMISLSIGVVLNQMASVPLDELMEKADIAMYRAKLDGKNRLAVYREEDTTYEINRRMEAEMESALRRREFLVYLQPRVNIVTSELYAAEALSRWEHPQDGLRLPKVYLTLFEKTGFISKMDLYIFEEVCRLKASWKGTELEHLPISVNMSRMHLYDRNFADTLEEIANEYQVKTSELEIEITEKTFVKDSEMLILMAETLKAKGFQVAIDDFGAGFSALYLLKDIPVDCISIDKGMLRAASEDLRGKKVLRNVISLCKDLKMDVVVEGVESKQEIDFLTSYGCQIVQGFYYSNPLPPDEFRIFAQNYIGNEKDCYSFRLNGNLNAEEGDFRGLLSGEGFEYRAGIFADSKSLHFPGGPTEENTVHIPSNVLVNDSFTVSLWVRPEVLRNWTSVFYVKYESGFFSMVPLAWDGNSDFRIRDSKEVNGWYDVTGCQLWENTWAHFVVSYNAKTETATAFINGEVVGVRENVPVNRYAKWIMLGGDVFQPSFVGDLCELLVFNEAKDYDFVKKLHENYTGKENFIGFKVE